VEAALGPVRDGYIELYVEELLTPDRANLRVRVRFENGRLLEISEALVVENECLRHLDYRYHCQDAGNDLVFRCDSAPHFPELPLFPHHKHLAEATEPAERPPIDRVLLEAGRVLAR
jgi:hypothetical protein